MSWRLTENQNCQLVARATEPLDDALLGDHTLSLEGNPFRIGIEAPKDAAVHLAAARCSAPLRHLHGRSDHIPFALRFLSR